MSEIIFCILISVAFISCVVWMTYCLYQRHQINKDLKRNDEVYQFRVGLINEGIFDMPSYNEMLKSKKPLTKENWITTK